MQRIVPIISMNLTGTGIKYFSWLNIFLILEEKNCLFLVPSNTSVNYSSRRWVWQWRWEGGCPFWWTTHPAVTLRCWWSQGQWWCKATHLMLPRGSHSRMSTGSPKSSSTSKSKAMQLQKHAILNLWSLFLLCVEFAVYCLWPCRHKKHFIQDAELGFAVLHCSTEQHCNPDVPFSECYIHCSRLFNVCSRLFCVNVVMYSVLQMQWVRYRNHRFHPNHWHRQTSWLTTQNQGPGITIRTLLLH